MSETNASVVWVRCPGCNGRFAWPSGDQQRPSRKDKPRCPYCNRELAQPATPRAEQ
jgi:uncharacterized protein with PIN domain